MRDQLVLMRLRSGLYTWNRYPVDGETVRAGVSWADRTDCFDAMCDANPDHASCTVVCDE